MIKEFVMNHVFMSTILLVGVISLLLQAMMTLSLKGYVKASANMKTTRKKVMINLKNQFETIYGMDYRVRNIGAYVDKYMLKLRLIGFSFSTWEKIPFLSAGIATLLTVGGIFYGYMNGAEKMAQIEILFAYGTVLACLFIFFHIFGIKSKKQQIQIQLVEYLENYLTNRLIRTKEGNKELKLLDASVENAFMEESTGKRETVSDTDVNMEEDVEMLKRLIREVETGNNERSKEQAEEGKRRGKTDSHKCMTDMEDDLDQEVAASKELKEEPEESDIELLEEFVQSFLA